jgi:hypothetical protein|tara:strand:- start:395 stop:931 length:537 start_codon:yes stop_codon:yes gene_type:complete
MTEAVSHIDADGNEYLSLTLRVSNPGVSVLYLNSVCVKNMFEDLDPLNVLRHAITIGNYNVGTAAVGHSVNTSLLPNISFPPENLRQFYLPTTFVVAPATYIEFDLVFAPFAGLIPSYGEFSAELLINYTTYTASNLSLSMDLTAQAYMDSVKSVNGIPAGNILSFFNMSKSNIISIK